MPAERLKMRRVREILRYRFAEGLGHKSIAARVGAAPSTVRALQGIRVFRTDQDGTVRFDYDLAGA